jgi:FkbM family methyltransferase
VTLSAVVKTALGVLVVFIAAMLYPPIRLSALVLAGRSPDCSMKSAVQAEAWRQRKLETKDRILSASKMIAKDGDLEQWQTPKGVFWTPHGSRYGLPFHLAEQEMQIYGDANRGVRKGDIVLDCGANIGTFTRTALDRGASKVIAIEPAPENLECLRRTFKDEIASGRVVVFPKGVWDKDDWLALHIHDDNSAADSFLIKGKHDEHSVKVPLTTIDKMVAELGLPSVDFIKMDIEGAEPNALRGAMGTLRTHHPRLAMSVYHEPNHPKVVPEIIKSAWPGYTMECGPCAVVGNRIRPDIQYYQ